MTNKKGDGMTPNPQANTLCSTCNMTKNDAESRVCSNSFHRPQVNTVDELIDEILEYSRSPFRSDSLAESSIRLVDARRAIQALITEARNKTIVDIQMYLWQPDQPDSDRPDFVYKKGDFYKSYTIKYSDGSSQRYMSTKPELKETK